MSTTPTTTVERRAWVAVITMAGLVGLAGFVVSFARVSEAMVPHFGGLAFVVPLAVDLGIAVFTALDLLMAHRGVRSKWLRFVPWSLIAVTIYLNAVGSPSVEGQVAHAVLPLMWAIAVEVGGSYARTVWGLHAPGSERLDPIRRSRWLLAPIATLKLWRRMILWEEPRYRVALERERDRVLARTAFREDYGWRWRSRAPRLEVARYRLGQHAPAAPPPAAAEPVTVRATAPEPTPDRPARTSRTAVARTVDQPLAPDRLKAARSAAAGLRSDGLKVNRTNLAERLRSTGMTVGTGEAGRLALAVKAESNGHGE